MTLKASTDRLPQYLSRMRGIYIENQDALKVIRRWDSPQTLFYCDPPYPSTDQRGYVHKYSEDDFKGLVATLAECEGSFILSAYGGMDTHCPEDWQRFKIKTRMSINNTGAVSKEDAQRIEWMWRRLNRVRPRDEIVDLYLSGKYDCYPAGFWDGEGVVTPESRRGQGILL